MKIVPVHMALVALTLCIVAGVQYVYGDDLFVITELGNVIPVEIIGSNQNAGAKSMANSIGLSSRVIGNDLNGKIVHGQNTVGTEESITPYVHVPHNTNFVAALNDAYGNKYPITSPYLDYVFDGTRITMTTNATQNVMNYSNTRTIYGNITASHNGNDITISGGGRLILKLNDMNYATFVNGTADTGIDIRMVQSPYDLMTLSHTGNYFIVNHIRANPTTHSLSVPVGSVDDSYKYGIFNYEQEGSFVVYHGKCCKGKYTQLGHKHITVGSDLIIGPGTNGYYEVDGDRTDTTVMDPHSVMKLGAKLLSTNYNRAVGPEHWVYDTLPVKQVGPTMEGDFNVRFEPVSDVYLVIDSTNSVGIAKIRAMNVDSRDFLRISGMDGSLAYKITFGNSSIEAGITNGDITINSFELPMEKNPLWLHLYDKSMLYQGSAPIGMIVFDGINGQNIKINHTDNIVYNVHAYVKIPVIGNVTIDQVVLYDKNDSSLSRLTLSYLNDEYHGGDSIFVPVIPGYKTITMSIDGIDATLNVADVLGGTGLRISDPKSNTVSIVSDSSIHQIKSTVGVVTYMIPQSDGNAKAHIRVSVSGNSEITNTKTYFENNPPLPPPPAPRDPLTTWIEVYVNGEKKETKQIFFSDSPVENHRGGNVGQHSVYHTADFTYLDVLVFDTISVPVKEADFVEFHFYNEILAYGTVPSTPIGFSVFKNQGHATATATLDYASINTSM